MKFLQLHAVGQLRHTAQNDPKTSPPLFLSGRKLNKKDIIEQNQTNATFTKQPSIVKLTHKKFNMSNFEDKKKTSREQSELQELLVCASTGTTTTKPKVTVINQRKHPEQ